MAKTLSELKVKNLQSRLHVLKQQYEAANRQLNSTLSALDKVTIEHQIQNIEAEIQNAEDELAQLRKHEATSGHQELPPHSDEDILLELIDQVQKENVVIFCGPGVSTSAKGLPGMEKLGQALAGFSNANETTIYEMAQAYEDKMGRNRLIRRLVSLIDDPTIAPSSVHHLIASLPFKQIVSINWDNLLEQTLKQINKPFTTVLRDADITYARDEDTLILRLFGSVEQSESIIITTNDIETLFNNRPRIFELIKSYFTTKVILFLGFQLADNTFRRFYDELTSNLRTPRRRAYIVQKVLSPSRNDEGFQIIDKDLLEFLKILDEKVKKPITSSSSTYNIYVEAAQGLAIGDHAQVSNYYATNELEVNSIKEELIMYKSNLKRLRAKMAMYGAGETPLSLLNQLDQVEAEIHRLETHLKELRD